ncbi:MAG: AcvB/VirJ family lysyl-phosphatidylglycerol hydrolase [Gemmatimonadaceae bacterium]
MRMSYGLGPALLAGLGAVACLGGTPRGPALSGEPLWQAAFRDPALGTVHLRRRGPRPSRIILFVTGDGGWNNDAVELADTLAGEDALVAGIDIGEWRETAERSADSCADFARPLGALATRLKVDEGAMRDPVVLVGHSAGATVAFLALSQAVTTPFAGAISLGFAPVLEYPRPPCNGPAFAARRANESEFTLSPTLGQLQRPWWVIQGTADRVTPPEDARDFAGRVHAAHYVPLVGQGHTFAGASGWMPAFRTALAALGGPHRLRRGSFAWEVPS